MKHFLIGILFCLPALLWAQPQQIISPDGQLVVNIDLNGGGTPIYNVYYKGQCFLKDSPLGLRTNLGDFTRNISFWKAGEAEAVARDYTLRNIKKSVVAYRANRRDFAFYQQRKNREGKEGKVHVMDINFEVSNNNIAFCYRIYPQGKPVVGDVEGEATAFAIPGGTTTFLCPQAKPMGGFARTSPSYETSYTLDEPMGKNGWGEGYTFPCLFKQGSKGWMLLSETGTDGNYVGCRLMGNGQGIYSIGFPQQGEQNGTGTATAAMRLPTCTPWRTITVGESLAPIVETTIPFDVVEPKPLPSWNGYDKYLYGRGTWSWIIGMDSSCNFDEQKRYIDFAADMGYESVLIDAWWDKRIGREKMAELAAYGKQQGVGIYLWYNSNGVWNDAPQSPFMHTGEGSRLAEMAWMKRIGIRGIKVDFFGGDKQDMMRLYEGILTDAASMGLLVIFHGCTLPRGWERMYPSYVASEAVLASENLHFGQGACDAEAFNACIHPFVRNTVGSMDFGGSTLNKRWSAGNDRGNYRRTSDVFALATAVLFQSAVQHFALAPNNLTDEPAWAIDFMKQVPTTWDDVKFIDGYPGKYVILARRHADQWFVVGINAQKETLKLNLRLPMFEAGSKVRLYSDDTLLNGSLKELKVNKKQEMKIEIPCNGGLVISSLNN